MDPCETGGALRRLFLSIWWQPGSASWLSPPPDLWPLRLAPANISASTHACGQSFLVLRCRVHLCRYVVGDVVLLERTARPRWW